MRLHRLAFLLILCLIMIQGHAQDGGVISGNLEANGNFFIRDSLIGAADIPQYDRQLFGADAWFNLTYSNWGFDFGLRFDLFNNSNLLNPNDSYSDQGIGRWFIRKQLDKLGISVGYLYDQIGSGLIFRAYEERPLLIDNALFGLRLTYDFSPNWQLKAFTGRQKQQFDLYAPIIKGFSLDGFVQAPTGSNWSLAPGIGFMNRTLDDATMDNLVATINTYPAEEAFVPKYNVYAFTVYNTLTAGAFSWYLETAYKTEEAINDPFGQLQLTDTTSITGRFIQSDGSALYTTLSYAKNGWGVILEARRIDRFQLRTRPQEELNRGVINFLPPLTRVNTYRLPSRYSPAAQELGEYGTQLDIRYSPNRKWSFNFNGSYLNQLNDELLYRELYLEVTHQLNKDWNLLGGVQMQQYNQRIYEFKPEAPIVETVTPFAEILYKIDRRKSLRAELQYMHTGEDPQTETRQDYGDWVFALVELGLAPHWTFTVSDMYNVTPGKNSPIGEGGEREQLHFPRIDIVFMQGSNRFGVSYVKQVEGVVCSGGICRVEPAFSGFKLSVNSTF